jgi:hypothetical protein
MILDYFIMETVRFPSTNIGMIQRLFFKNFFLQISIFILCGAVCDCVPPLNLINRGGHSSSLRLPASSCLLGASDTNWTDQKT